MLIGSEGSMGKRYQAILKYLGEPFECWDKKLEVPDVPLDGRYSRIIIASPTESHASWVKWFQRYNKPILCEKPLSHDLGEVKEMLGYQLLTTMLQYSQLVHSHSEEPSHYDYFRTGPDGLAWDCFQIIGLAKGKVTLKNESPIWDCKINGQRLDIAAMDGAYLSFVKGWLSGRIKQNPNDIYQMHVKTAEMAGELEQKIKD